MLPRIYRHGDHIPDPHIHEMRAKIRVAVEADRPLPDRRRRRAPRHDPGHVPGRPSTDPAEAMNARYPDRPLARAAAETRAPGIRRARRWRRHRISSTSPATTRCRSSGRPCWCSSPDAAPRCSCRSSSGRSRRRRRSGRAIELIGVDATAIDPYDAAVAAPARRRAASRSGTDCGPSHLLGAAGRGARGLVRTGLAR